jgi:hypothetical protein
MPLETYFAMYFAAVASIQYHPANPPDKRMSLQECANVAAAMLSIHYERFPVRD